MSHMEKIALDYIVKFKMVNGFAPTQDEIKKGLNTKSKQWVSEMLDNLENDGFIVRTKNSPRTIIVVKFPNDFLQN